MVGERQRWRRRTCSSFIEENYLAFVQSDILNCFAVLIVVVVVVVVVVVDIVVVVVF